MIYTVTNYFTRLWAFSGENDLFLYAILEKVDAKVEGASQRIQEDCMTLLKLSKVLVFKLLEQ